MLVRVFDKQRNTYFKSEVYAVINSGWYQKQLVIATSNGESYFKFYDYLDKSDPHAPNVLINSILFDGFNSAFEWIYKKSGDVDKHLEGFSELLNDDIRFFDYRGYSWIFKNKPLLTKLLKGDMVSTKGYESQMVDSNGYKIYGWNYVESQKDIDFILEQTSAFHDTVLRELNYVSGAYVDDKNAMYCTDSLRRITVRFESQWCRPVEMVFEGVTAMNLRPSEDNYSSNIFGVTFVLQNCAVFFCDDEMDKIDKTYKGTWIESYSLRWRFCD